MKHLLLIVPFCLCSISLQAQEVEFDIPTEIDIIQGRLSVAFQDGVHEDAARALVSEMGYEIIEASFEPRYVWATLEDFLSDEHVERFENDQRVISLTQEPLPVLTTGEEAEQSPVKVSLAVVFAHYVANEEAAALLKDIAGVVVSRTEKRPNEIVIDVGDRDAEAYDSLEGREEVKWVTYVGVAGE